MLNAMLVAVSVDACRRPHGAPHGDAHARPTSCPSKMIDDLITKTILRSQLSLEPVLLTGAKNDATQPEFRCT